MSFLLQTTPKDPGVLGSVTVMIFMAALVAGVMPARRVTPVDPIEALRHE